MCISIFKLIYIFIYEAWFVVNLRIQNGKYDFMYPLWCMHLQGDTYMECTLFTTKHTHTNTQNAHAISTSFPAEAETSFDCAPFVDTHISLIMSPMIMTTTYKITPNKCTHTHPIASQSHHSPIPIDFRLCRIHPQACMYLYMFQQKLIPFPELYGVQWQSPLPLSISSFIRAQWCEKNDNQVEDSLEK